MYSCSNYQTVVQTEVGSTSQLKAELVPQYKCSSKPFGTPLLSLTGCYLKLWSEASPQVSGHQIWGGRKGEKKDMERGHKKERGSKSGENTFPGFWQLEQLRFCPPPSFRPETAHCAHRCVWGKVVMLCQNGESCVMRKSRENAHSCLMFFCIKRLVEQLQLFHVSVRYPSTPGWSYILSSLAYGSVFTVSVYRILFFMNDMLMSRIF